MKTILLAGGTGFIGRKLEITLVNQGYSVVILSRNPKRINEFFWNPSKKEIDFKALENVTAIINLCGANIGERRWSEKRKAELLNSRIEPTQFLASLIPQLPILESYISASGISCYGFDSLTKIYTETDPFGQDYLSQLVKQWENASDLFNDKCRVVKMRTAVVLDLNEGALQKIIAPIKWGIGSPLGDGNQIMPWVYIDDLTNSFLFAVQNPIEGAFNCVGGNDSNKNFTRKIARCLKKSFWFPNVPSFLLKLIFGEMSDLVLKGVHVSNHKFSATGFKFQYSKIEEIFQVKST